MNFLTTKSKNLMATAKKAAQKNEFSIAFISRELQKNLKDPKQKKKLESLLKKIEDLPTSKGGKFCSEYETKYKPILMMILMLFTFSPKIKTAIKGLMAGVDEVCNPTPDV